MNFSDLQEAIFQATGLADTSAGRLDWVIQRNRDKLNETLDEICSICAPSITSLVREATLNIVSASGLSSPTNGYLGVYRLNDWCGRLLSGYTQDNLAHKVELRNARSADYDGSRNTSFTPIQGGPYEFIKCPRSEIAIYSGEASTHYGATASEGATSVLLGDLASVPDSTWHGLMLRLNGEYADYKITDHSGQSLTIDRPVRARISGIGTDGVGVGYGVTRWEVSPPHRFQVQVVPSPRAAGSAQYRFMAIPRKMIYASDTPELMDAYHHLIYKGAIKKIGAAEISQDRYQMFSQEYDEAIQMMQKSEAMEQVDVSVGPTYGTNMDFQPRRGVMPGQYFRGGYW